jgi:hypothetical protein
LFPYNNNKPIQVPEPNKNIHHRATESIENLTAKNLPNNDRCAAIRGRDQFPLVIRQTSLLSELCCALCVPRASVVYYSYLAEARLQLFPYRRAVYANRSPAQIRK